MIFDAPQADEFAFIFDSWANSFRRSPWAGCVPNNMFDAVSRAAAAGIIDRGAHVVVALPDGDTRRIMGYAVSEPAKGVLHWLYVKNDFRRMGVGRALLQQVTDQMPVPGQSRTYSHRTRMSDRFLRDWTWDPVTARVKD